MAYQVKANDVRQYEEDGVVCLRGVIDRDVCSQLLDATLEFAEKGQGDKADLREGSSGRYFVARDMAKTVCVFEDFAFRSILPKVASELMGTKNIRFFYDQVFLVEPGTQRSTPWHNDLPYWPFEGNDIISLWVALTGVTSESSPLQYVAGSHRSGKMYRPVSPRDDAQPSDMTLERAPNYSDPDHQAGKRILSWELQPGDVLAHHPLTLHGSHANRSKGQRRCGLSLRYLGDDVRYCPRPLIRTKTTYNAPAGAYPADDAQLPRVIL